LANLTERPVRRWAGRGAGIGALAGAGGGAVTQLFTRGKEIKVPAETTMTFELERTLVMHP
jgi:hypothetical protein